MSQTKTTAKPAAKPRPKPKGKQPFDRGALFRLCRMLHAYLSAFAFLALIFFSITGLMLDHPEWFNSMLPKEKTAEVEVTADQIAKARTLGEPGPALAQAVGKLTTLKGAYASADIEGDQALVRLDGPKGTSDIDLNLSTGKASVRTGNPNAALIILDLHRGKNVGAAWRAVIDLSAYLILALSLIGYVLFFSLRFRLRTSLILTGVSLAVMIGIFMAFVP